SHPPQRLHVRTKPRLAERQNNNVRRNNSVKHKSRQREPPSNTKLKNARHNSGVKSRSKPLGRPSKGKRDRQGRHRTGLRHRSKHRSAPAWSSSVERPNRNALARPMNNSVPTSAGELMSNGA